ncbi:MAG: hypothetical protein AAF182_02820 [Pseudomonadota bacterium]
MRHHLHKNHNNQRGNVLFIVFIAVALIAALTVAIQGSNRSETANIDDETLIIKLTEVKRYAGEVERAVNFVLNNGYSESDIRFAHPDNHPDYGDLDRDDDKSNQIFHADGGGAAFRDPPKNVNDGSQWEFYGGTALPALGSDRAELVVVLPNVSDAFCEMINDSVGQTKKPLDTGAGSASLSSSGGCVYLGDGGRFNDRVQFYSDPNTMNENTFIENERQNQVIPAPQACVQCSSGDNHFYHAILSR